MFNKKKKTVASSTGKIKAFVCSTGKIKKQSYVQQEK
jgi:hypothetical protein